MADKRQFKTPPRGYFDKIKDLKGKRCTFRFVGGSVRQGILDDMEVNRPALLIIFDGEKEPEWVLGGVLSVKPVVEKVPEILNSEMKDYTGAQS